MKILRDFNLKFFRNFKIYIYFTLNFLIKKDEYILKITIYSYLFIILFIL